MLILLVNNKYNSNHSNSFWQKEFLKYNQDWQINTINRIIYYIYLKKIYNNLDLSLII